MDDREQKIVQLAETCKGPDEFMHKIEKSYEIPPGKKGNFFFKVAKILQESSYSLLALDLLNHALKHFIRDHNKTGESKCLLNLGSIYYLLGNYTKAITYLQKSLKIAEEIGDKITESVCYTSLGFIYSDQEDFEKAIDYYRRSLEIDREIGNKDGELRCYGNLANAHQDLGNYREAIDYNEKLLKNVGEIGDKMLESQCCMNLGIVYTSLEDFEKAIKYYEQSLEIAQEMGYKYGESGCLTNLGIIYCNLGDFEKAITCHKRSLEIDKDIGDREGESMDYVNLGNDYRGLEDYTRAIECYTRSLEIAGETKNKERESGCCLNVGSVHHTLGEHREAVKYFENSLKIAKEIGDKEKELKCYSNLQDCYYELGDFRRAIENSEKSLEIAKSIGDRNEESSSYISLGNAYHLLGDNRKAIGYYEKAEEIAKEMGNRRKELICSTNLGSVYHSLGDSTKAMDYGEKSLKIAREVKDQYGEVASYTNLALECRCLGDFKKAFTYLGKSLKIAKEIGNWNGELKCYMNLGATYYTLGNIKRSIKYHEKALELAKEKGDAYSERIINMGLGHMYAESDFECAYDHFSRSIESSEMILENLVEEQHKVVFSALESHVYHHMVNLCIDLKREEKAFEYAEGSKSRAFLDLMATTEIRPTCRVTDELQSLLSNEERCLAQLRRIQTRHMREFADAPEPGEVDTIYGRLTSIYNKIEEIDPEYVFMRTGGPLPLSKVQEILSSQKDAVLVEYFTAEDRTFIFIVTHDTMEVKSVYLSSEMLNHYMEELQNRPSYPWRLDNLLHDLGTYLIEPVAEYLKKNDLIYFVPYGALHYLPLHAFTLHGEPVIRKHPVVYVPSASLLRFCQSKGSGTLHSCASFGVDFEEEAEEVAALFDTKAHKNSLATKRDFMACKDKDVFHFACHGHFNYEDPLSSGIRLYDGILTAREVFGVRLNAELVTLSACETGYNQVSPGDELIGLTRAFLYAGAPSVVVSLWPVYSPSTQELMLEFYKKLRRGLDKASALQQAQITIMEKKKYSHLYFWAPFVLIGNWK